MCVIAPDPPTEYLGALTDERLVGLFRSGIDDAFAELDRRHRRTVCGYLGRRLRGRDDVEDIAQDVMLRAYAQLRRDNAPIAHLRAWLLRVAHNRAIDLLRATRQTDELPDMLPARDDLAADSAARDELSQALAVLRSLPAGQRRALVLNAVHGVPYEHVAELLGTTPKGAKALAFRGRTAVRQRVMTDDATGA